MSNVAHLALGSNLGDRRANLDAALSLLRENGVDVVRVSRFHETDPVGGPAGQGRYLNAVAEVTTTLLPRALHALMANIEDRLGRIRSTPNAPRTIDLDLLLYGAEIIAEPDRSLIVPHPRLQDRHFVLEPLVEIAPSVSHPVFQKSMADLLDDLRCRLERERNQSLGKELCGLRALVTGSTGGIGRAIAMALAEAGGDVLIHGRRSLGRARVVAESCRKHGGRSETLQADLREENACLDLAKSSWRTWNGLDLLVCNAGADTLTGDAAHWPFEQKLAELWAVDVRATMLLARWVGAKMQQRGSGVILTTGWDQATTGMEGDSGQLFGAVKGAVMSFTLSLARSLAPEVRVNCIAPGWIKTAWGENASEVWQERVRRETPLGRWGTPEDIANTVRWLVSPAAEFITGQVIRVNGGAVRG